MKNQNKLTIEQIIEIGISGLEATLLTKLTDKQRAVYIMGFTSALVTLKNFGEFSEYYILELITKIQSSKELNKDIKDWIDSLDKRKK